MPTTSPVGSLPPAPRPSQDAGIRDTIIETSFDAGKIPPIDQLDLFALSPKAALRLFTCAVSSTICNENKSRAPPTPPISSPTTPNNNTMMSFVEQASMVHDAMGKNPHRHGPLTSNDIPRHHRTPIGSPEAHPHDISSTQPPLLEIDEDYTEYEKQCLRMARTFYSKNPPDIVLEEYLKRIHVYCAMSTGVYLAAACYVQRITGMLWTTSAQDDNDRDPDETTYVRITPRSAHRLSLAALRLAQKAMEDNTWNHKRFAMVGGVPNANLTRLEIALCYLLDFKLYCPNDELLNAARAIIRGNPDVLVAQA